MSLTISVENVSKYYKLGTIGRGTLREDLHRWWAQLNGKPDPVHKIGEPSRGNIHGNILWALRDVSFQVKQGEVVGLIGHNGAGKSTLLKILTRITAPTSGQIKMKGRVASLLEVGTGFHRELTGRENVYLNGAILGMTRAEVNRKFDEIVAFSGVEDFIDTPVKRYSSGMHVRLGFAVAAHLDPEILLVDEVLAVGDASFQKKCLGKLEEVSATGRTVLFVSHSMNAITRLCNRAILLQSGKIYQDGPAHEVVGKYLHSGSRKSAVSEWANPSEAPGNEWVRLRAMRVLSESGEIMEVHNIQQDVKVQIEYEVLRNGLKMIPKFHIVNEQDITVFVTQDPDLYWRRQPRSTGVYSSTLSIPGNFLAEGKYFVWGAMVTHDPDVVHFFEPEAVAFQIVDSLDGKSARGDYAGHVPGVVRPILPWATEVLEDRSVEAV